MTKVRIWTVTDVANNLGTCTTTSTYLPGSLIETVTVDEDNKQIIEYKDFEGKTILKNTTYCRCKQWSRIGPMAGSVRTIYTTSTAAYDASFSQAACKYYQATDGISMPMAVPLTRAMLPFRRRSSRQEYSEENTGQGCGVQSYLISATG